MTANSVLNVMDWQKAVWRDKSLVVLTDGPAGTGKSHLWAHKIDAYMRKYPGATGLMVRKTRESMTNSTLLFFARVVVGDDPHVEWKRQERRFEYANGSVLAYGGMKDASQREAIRSIGQDGGLDFVWMEEAHLFTLEDFEETLPRMRGKAAYTYYLNQGYTRAEAEQLAWVQIGLSTNPDSEGHWIYQRLIRGGQASRHFYVGDNPHNPRNYSTDILGRLTGVRRKRLKDGLWVSAEGAVYEDYRYEVHVVEPFVIPSNWSRFRAIDFGYRNPFVCQWWAVDPDGRLYLYREIYMTGRTVRAHGEQIKQVESGVSASDWIEMDASARESAWRGRTSERGLISWTVADHDAEDRATLEEMGIITRPAEKAISRGIEKVQERLIDAGDGRARLYFFNDALIEVDQALIDQKKPASTIDEISGYVYPVGADGKPVKETPIDLDNHGMDAMRYAVMSVDGGGAVLPARRAKAQYGGR